MIFTLNKYKLILNDLIKLMNNYNLKKNCQKTVNQYSNLSLNNGYKQENINENTVVNQFKQFFFANKLK